MRAPTMLHANVLATSCACQKMAYMCRKATFPGNMQSVKLIARLRLLCTYKAAYIFVSYIRTLYSYCIFAPYTSTLVLALSCFGAIIETVVILIICIAIIFAITPACCF